MTFFEWVEDRLGHFVLQAVFVIVSTTVLLSTGTSIGIITLLLIMWFFFFIGIVFSIRFYRNAVFLGENKKIPGR